MVYYSKESVFERDGNRCVYCGSEGDLTIDHVKPIGSYPDGRNNEMHDEENVVTACRDCNQLKGSDPLGAFFIKHPDRKEYYLRNASLLLIGQMQRARVA